MPSGTTSNGIRLVSSNTSLSIGSAVSLTGFGSVYQYNANTLNNGGTINANSAGNTLNINTTSFTNTETTEVQNGAVLSVTSANTDSGNVLVSTGGILDVNYVGTGASTGLGSIFDILDYGSIASSISGSQFFTNEGAGGLITRHDGFTYMLINDTVNNQLQLKELTAGNPVPETSSVISLGLLPALGLGGLSVGARRRSAVR